MTRRCRKILTGVSEYKEGFDVYLEVTDGSYTPDEDESQWPGNGRLVIVALNAGGHDSTEVDLLELLAWVKINRPELLNSLEGLK